MESTGLNWQLLLAIAAGVGLLISEILPFTKGKANGILGAIASVLKVIGGKKK